MKLNFNIKIKSKNYKLFIILLRIVRLDVLIVKSLFSIYYIFYICVFYFMYLCIYYMNL